MDELHLVSSKRELRYLASKKIFNDFLLAEIIMGFNGIVFPFGCSSLLTGEIVSYCSTMSINLLTLSCK